MKRYIKNSEDFNEVDDSTSAVAITVVLTKGQYEALKSGEIQFGSIGSKMIFKAAERAAKDMEGMG